MIHKIDVVDIPTEFIVRRLSIDCNWTEENSYWFALIMNQRFPNLVIFYLSVAKKFIVIDLELKYYYDWYGRHEVNEISRNDILIRWDTLQFEDPVYYNRLVRDYIK